MDLYGRGLPLFFSGELFLAWGGGLYKEWYDISGKHVYLQCGSSQWRRLQSWGALLLLREGEVEEK